MHTRISSRRPRLVAAVFACGIAATGLAFCLADAATARASWTRQIVTHVGHAETVLSSKLAFGHDRSMPVRVAASDRDDYVELLSKAGIAHFSWNE